MLKLLVVEDSPLILKIMKRVFSFHAKTIDVTFSSTMEEAALLMDMSSGYFDAALVDLCLPDAPNGEIVDYVLGKGLVCIVLTSKEDDFLRNNLLNKGVVDYIQKSNRKALNYAIKLIQSIKRNGDKKVLVVEDSKLTTKHIFNSLEPHGYQLYFAESAESALQLLSSDQEFDIAVIDYHLPDLNGLKLIEKVDSLAISKVPMILGMSSDTSGSLSSAFIKYGGDDFLRKPFTSEELAARLMKMLERQELANHLRLAAFQDPLTKINNRHAVYDYISQFKGHNKRVHLALLDLDYFKSINDTYGHAIGDKVLCGFARGLADSFSSDFYARFGGEEFLIIAEQSLSQMAQKFAQLREHCLKLHFDLSLSRAITFSGGVIFGELTDFQSLCNNADVMLYKAKNEGRDQLCYWS